LRGALSIPPELLNGIEWQPSSVQRGEFGVVPFVEGEGGGDGADG
jgi:hypothetical protein